MRQVADLMTRDVVTLKESDRLAHIDALLRRTGIRHLPVVRGRKLVGLVAKEELLRALAEGAGAEGADARCAADIMRRDVTRVHPEMLLREALRITLESRFGCLPVVDRQEHLVGILTHADFVRLAAQLLDDVDRHELAAEYGA